MKLLGIDYGQSKIGLALADTDSRTATPLLIMKNRRHDSIQQAIKDLCIKEKIDKLVIGLPVNPQAKSNQAIDQIRQWGTELSAILKLPVDYQDERFSTLQAQRISHNHYKHISSQDDDIAAMLILQNYLDKTV